MWTYLAALKCVSHASVAVHVSIPQHLEERGRSITSLRWSLLHRQIMAILGDIRPCLKIKEIRYIWITEYRPTKLFSDHERETGMFSNMDCSKESQTSELRGPEEKQDRWHSKSKCHRTFPELVANIKLDVEITLNLYNENKSTSSFFISLRPSLNL